MSSLECGSRDPVKPRSADGKRAQQKAPWRAMAIVVTAACGLLGVSVAPRVWTEFQIRKARRLMDARQDARALDLLRRAERFQPNSGSIQFHLGRVHRHLGDTETSGKHLAIARQNGYAEHLVDREYQLISAQQGQFGEIEPYIGALLANEVTELPDICEALARGFVKTLRFRDAHRMLDSWALVEHTDPVLHTMRGELFRLRDEWKPAIDSYKMALLHDPDHADALLGLGEAFLEMAQWSEAEEAFRRARPLFEVRENADRERVERGLVRCLIELRSDDPSRRDEARALTADLTADLTANDEWRPMLARLALAEKRPDRAIAWLAPRVACWPDEIATASLEAEAFRALGRVEDADRRTRAVELAAREWSGVAPLLKVLDEQPKNADVRYEIGELVVRLRSRRDGIRWLEAATLLDSFHRAAHERLIATCEKAGEVELGIRFRRRMESIVEVVHR